MSNNDLISREALKEAIRKRLCISSLKYLTAQEKVIVEEIDNALPVNDCPNCEYKLEADYIRSSSSYKELIDLRKFKETNTRPQCEWESVGFVNMKYAWFRCSNCHKTTRIYMDSNNDFCCIADIRKKAIACLYCGAKMKGGAE